MIPLTTSPCEHPFKGSAHPSPALAGLGTNPTASHASAQGCAAMHVCLQYMCAAMQMCPHSLQSMCQHWSAVALLPTCVGCASVQDVAAQESLRPCACAWRCARCLVKRGWPGAYCRGLCAAIVSAAWAQMLTAGQIAHKLIGRSGRREGGGEADPRVGEGGYGPGAGLARRGGLVRCRGRTCWASVVWVCAM